MTQFLLSVLVGVVVALPLLYALGRRSGRRSEPGPVAEQPVVPEEDLDEAREARAIDPNNPPRYSVYKPDTYSLLRAPHCSCHDRPILQGEKVLLWPIPGHPDGGIDIFCEKTYGVLG
jgi:hypothetical protein